MNKVMIIYWSGTGNTEAMAKAVAEGVTQAGGAAVLIPAEDANASMVADATAFALGCPSMGAEQLEESVMEPLMCELDGAISGKTIALFGSYGWGDGEWMREWEQRIANDGATVWNDEGIIANEAPDAQTVEKCKAAGAGLFSL